VTGLYHQDFVEIPDLHQREEIHGAQTMDVSYLSHMVMALDPRSIDLSHSSSREPLYKDRPGLEL
jgi:hypothetical protein